MSCKSPLMRVEHLGNYEIAADGHKYTKAVIASRDEFYSFINNANGNYKYTEIPCRKCIGCRLDYAKNWANRGELEAKKWQQNYFITLTYDDEHLPMPKNPPEECKGTLVKDELSKFIKRLREYMKREYNQDQIRFMGCGEYGEKGQRPHYHAIIFNLNLPTETFYNSRIIEKNIYWQNKIIEKCWKKGFSTVSEANWNNIAYTARYITKKIIGPESEEEYKAKGQLPEYFRTSRNPGIGGHYYQEHKEEYLKGNTLIHKRNGSVNVRKIEYFEKLHEKEDKNDAQKRKLKRKAASEQQTKLQMQTTSVSYMEQKAIEAKSLAAKTKSLPRIMD